MTGAAIGKDKDRLWCILQDEKMFYMGGLKALNMTPDNAGIAHCMKSSDNGKIKLSYDISDYSALSDEIGRLSVDDIIAVVKSLTQSVITVSNNGMMSLQSTVFDMDKVFISGSRSQGFNTLIIYLPLVVQSSMGGDEGSDNYFRFLHELLRSAGRASVDPELRPLSAALENNRNSLENFYRNLSSLEPDPRPDPGPGPRSEPKPAPKPDPKPNPKDDPSPKPPKKNGKKAAVLVTQIITLAISIIVYYFVGPIAIAAVLFVDAIAVVLILTTGGRKQVKSEYVPPTPSGGSGNYDTEEWDEFSPTVRLVGQNTPMMLKFTIEKADFTIGRSSDCDAIIPETLKAISGHHCRIITENGSMFVRDDFTSGKRTGSKNGTYINGSANRIEPKQKAKLQINDTLQLANYRFKVEHI